MKNIIEILSYCLIGFRCVLSVLVATQGGTTPFILGCVGLIAVATTIYAWCVGKPDLTWRGLSVGIGHLAILLYQRTETGNDWVTVLFWILFMLQCWAKVHLLGRCTVTGPVWVSLCMTGPYRIVRHPMTAVELLMAQAFFVQYPSAWNFGVMCFVVATKFFITEQEEKFLVAFPAYRDYKKLVPYRFFYRIY